MSLLPDGTGAFTRGLGMLVNKDNLGFGDRSWRYSMLVEDGEIVEIVRKNPARATTLKAILSRFPMQTRC